MDMRTTVHRIVALLAVTTAAAAQAERPARIEGIAVHAIDAFSASERAEPPASAEAYACATLGYLRLGDVAAARRAVRACCHVPADVPTPWPALCSYWLLRATGDVAFARECLPLAAPSAAAAHFADAALAVHATLCLAAIQEEVDGARPGDSEASRDAIAAWLDVERQAWLPGSGRFRTRLTGGAIVPPDEPATATLAPAAFGMLIASGDHVERHLRTVLERFEPRSFPGSMEPADSDAAAFLLAAAVQLGDEDAKTAAWRSLERLPTRELRLERAARCLDAQVFAITGLRLATGVGVDQGWIRLRPWLPPGAEAVHFAGLVAEGTRFDLAIERRRGAPAADEFGEEAMRTDLHGERMRVTIRIGDGRARLVLQGPTVQYVTTLTAGDTFTRSLPTSHP